MIYFMKQLLEECVHWGIANQIKTRTSLNPETPCPFFSGTKLLIACGSSNDTSYILHVYFDGTSISQIKYENLPNVPHFFENAAFGSFKGGTLIMGGRLSNGQCLEFDRNEYKVIPSLNINRWEAASTFIQNKIVISGGYDGRNINNWSKYFLHTCLYTDEYIYTNKW